MTYEEMTEIRNRIREISKQCESLKAEKSKLQELIAKHGLAVEQEKANDLVGKFFKLKRNDTCKYYDGMIAFKVLDVIQYGTGYHVDFRHDCVCVMDGDDEISLRQRRLSLFSKDSDRLNHPSNDCPLVIDKYEEITKEEFINISEKHMKKVLGE